MDGSANLPDARPALEMTAPEVRPKSGTQPGSAASRFQRLRNAPWGRLLSPDDLYPLALLSLFLVLPPPLGNLVLALFAVLATVIALRIWSRCEPGEN